MALACADGALAEPCSDFVGRIVAPQSFDQAAASLGDLSPKGEYETTAAYEARRAASAPKGPIIVFKKPEDTKFFQYDADGGALGVKSFALDNTSMNWWRAFYAAKPEGVEASTLSNRAVVLQQVDRPAGAYRAQNAFGVSVEVMKVDRFTQGVFERPSPGDYGVFPDRKDHVIGAIPMDPATAQRIKPQLGGAFLILPKPPYYLAGKFSHGDVTIQNPLDIVEHFKIIVADLKCGFILDASNRVLGAYETK